MSPLLQEPLVGQVRPIEIRGTVEVQKEHLFLRAQRRELVHELTNRLFIEIGRDRHPGETRENTCH